MRRTVFAVCGGAMTEPKRFAMSIVMLGMRFGAVSASNP
jgi:hypothetical protein